VRSKSSVSETAFTHLKHQ